MYEMGFFDKILEKIGLKKPEASVGGEAKGGMKAKDDVATATKQPVGGTPIRSMPQSEDDKKVKAISEVDVVAHLETLSKGKGLNWKVSIVDLLKLLDLDSSREAREELAKELGCPADQMSDSARMNVWLHKTVLKKIAENGGNIPADLLD
jgi:hypothetical protein